LTVIADYEKNVLDILAGKVGMASSEDLIGERVYRTRVVAELEQILLMVARSLQ